MLSEPKLLRIDVNHSNIGFAVPIAGGLSKVRGKFSEFRVDLNHDDEDITKSTMDVKIAAKSIDTGINQRDDHLRTADFFSTPVTKTRAGHVLHAKSNPQVREFWTLMAFDG